MAKKRGEQFEIFATEYLNKEFGNSSVWFAKNNTFDSTSSDIRVYKNDNLFCYIEAKDTKAQSGQFVVIPQDGAFVYSTRNKSVQTPVATYMMRVMNRRFDVFSQAGTAGLTIDVKKEEQAQWIIDYYKAKGADYIIGRKNQPFIFPVENFLNYYDISAVIRAKKSGSGAPAKKAMPALREYFSNATRLWEETQKKRKVFVEQAGRKDHEYFSVDGVNYMLRLLDDESDRYEIRKLSKTKNMTVIFSIEAKREQKEEDLIAFRKALAAR